MKHRKSIRENTTKTAKLRQIDVSGVFASWENFCQSGSSWLQLKAILAVITKRC